MNDAVHKSLNNLHVSEDSQNDEYNVDNDDYIFSRALQNDEYNVDNDDYIFSRAIQKNEYNVDNDDYIFSRMMNIMLIMMITKVERNRPPGGERSVISG